MAQTQTTALFRAYIAGSTLVTAAICSLEPDGLPYQIIASTGQAGWVALSFMSAVALWALADVFVNDVMPANFYLHAAMRQRHLTYMGLALGLMSLAYVFTARNGWSAISLRPIFDATFAAGVAFQDLFQRRRRGGPYARQVW